MFLPSPDAHAEIGGCRSDPAVFLSNGMALDLSATIDDTNTDVEQVTYIVYAPVGTRVTSVIYTSGPLGPKETLQFNPDNPAHDYAVATVVSTMTSGVRVTATTVAASANGAALASADGHNGQHLRVHFSQ